MLVVTHPETIASQNEGEMVCHAQQLAKVDATVDSNNPPLMHQRNCSLNALLIVGSNHDLSIRLLAQLHQGICTSAQKQSYCQA